VDAVLCHGQDTYKTVHSHSYARSKMPQYKIVNNVELFSHDWFQGNSIRAPTGDNRHNYQMGPYETKNSENKFLYSHYLTSNYCENLEQTVYKYIRR